MAVRVLLSSTAQEVLRHLHPSTKKRMKVALKRLKATWPTPTDLDVEQLRGAAHLQPIYRLRVGPWRVVFRASRNRLEVVRVFHRRDGYGWLEGV